MVELRTRFEKKVDRHTTPDGCHSWTAGMFGTGYGAISVNGGPLKAHRVAWELANGPIPEGKCVCHRCDNPACVRVEHLFLGSHAENMSDMATKGRSYKGPRGFGESHGMVKLTEQQVLSIRRRHAAGGISYRKLAAEYNVTDVLVSYIVRRKIWKHLP